MNDLTIKKTIMRKKHFIRVAGLVLLMAVSIPGFSNTTVDPITATAAKTEDARAHQLMQRLEEIKTMDKSNLSREDKKELRKEVKVIRKDLKDNHHTVYLSLGALIIIILLLILIL